MATQAQLAANQANAQKSTGPTSPDGKAAVAKNALKTGLTGRTVLLPTDDAALYEKHLESFRLRYNPINDTETELVQSVADTQWRLARIPSLEAGIYALGRAKLADLHANENDPQQRAALIEAEVYLAYERPLRNLQIQEARLRRQLEKDRDTLETMQNSRIEKAQALLKRAATSYFGHVAHGHPFHFSQFGSEFSMEQIDKEARRTYVNFHFPELPKKPKAA